MFSTGVNLSSSSDSNLSSRPFRSSSDASTAYARANLVRLDSQIVLFEQNIEAIEHAMVVFPLHRQLSIEALDHSSEFKSMEAARNISRRLRSDALTDLNQTRTY
jgi:hypothetical protein